MDEPRRILVADDDRIVRRLLSVNLERWGYDATVVADGQEAWGILQGDDPPGLVLLDWVMPGLDGVEICRRLRATERRKNSYILLLSAKQNKTDIIEAFEAGADDYLTKPIHLRELELRLKAAERVVASRRQSLLPAAATPSGAAAAAAAAAAVAPQSPSDASLAGSVVAQKYKVTRPIAAGGMGTVWEGVHETLGTRVAIKFIRPEHIDNQDTLARFETEARVTARLQSRHAVKVYDYGVTNGGLPYLVMEYLEGRCLTDIVIEDGPLAPSEVATVIAQTAHALGKAHMAGIIHRDVKPDNIVLVDDDEAPPGEKRRMAKLVDFGVAKVTAPVELDAKSSPMSRALRRGTAVGTWVGTPSYMSPEQLLASGEPDLHADLWALAVSAFVALTARHPFDCENDSELVAKICLQPPPVPSMVDPALPPALDDWFLRACAPAPKERYETARELAEALLAACRKPGADAVAVRTPTPVEPPEFAATARPRQLPSPTPRLVTPMEQTRVERSNSTEQARLDALLEAASVKPPPQVDAAPVTVALAAPVGAPAVRTSVPARASMRPPTSAWNLRAVAGFALGVVVAIGAMLLARA